MKSKVFIVIGIILLLVCCVQGLYYLENFEEIYYAQIDNTKLEKLSTSDNMKYEYTLNSYNKNGKRKKLKFKTSRELKEKAYILLEVKTFGVHKWEEIQYDDLPQKVQNKIDK